MSDTTIFDRLPFLSRKKTSSPHITGSMPVTQQNPSTPQSAQSQHAPARLTGSTNPGASSSVSDKLTSSDRSSHFDGPTHAAAPISADATYVLNVNGMDYNVSVPPEMPLLWVLRDVIGLTGTKYGCGFNVCGACMVLIDDVGTLTCNLQVSTVVGKKILTVEGLAGDSVGRKVQQAWLDNQVPQCGFCQPGFLIEVTSAIKNGKSGALILKELDHICACGTYARMIKAVETLGI